MAGRLILCLDGTWNSAFKPLVRDDKTVLKPANPLKLARAVRPVDPTDNTRQVTYYDSGVGALGLYPGLSNKVLNFVDNKLGGGWGAGFEANIEQAMTFISNNHLPDDQIYVFGFSRGAAQARGLTRFISWLGGVPEKNDAYYIPIFFRHYLKHKGGSTPDKAVDKFESITIRPIQITFLGVWDTVMALGSRFKARGGTSVAEKSFHVGAKPADCVLNARQALAIDERRYDFRPEVWRDSSPDQSLEQRWFAGAHANVGGGYGNDGLANCALHWIINAAKTSGLAVDDEFLKKYKPFSRDTLNVSYSFQYKAIETIRFKRGAGVRRLCAYPDTANLALHPSVIERLCSDPDRFEEMTGPYRSKDVVKIAKKHDHDKDGFVRSYGLDPKTYPFPDLD